MRVFTLLSMLFWCCSWVFAVTSDTVVFTNQTLNFRNLSSIVDRRTEFCSRARMLANGSLALKDALRGIHMTVVAPHYAGNEVFFDVNEDEGTSSGLQYEVLLKLAEKSGMQLTIHTHPASSFLPEMSWTQYAVAATTKYDLVIDWLLETAERLSYGLRNPQNFMDLSLELTTSQTYTEPSYYEKFWQFSKPFSNELWGTLVGITMATAILYVVVERRYNHDDFVFGAPYEYDVGNVFFLSFMQFTQITNLSPITRLGKVIVATYSFVIFVASASYTAELASALVISRSAKICSSVETCLASDPGSKICVQDKTVIADSVLALYPYLQENQQIYFCQSDPFVCYLEGHCTAVVQSYLPTEMIKRKKVHNTDCTLSRADTLLPAVGGWFGKIDYSHRCTSSLLDAVGYQLLAMRLNGEIAPLITAALKASETMAPCSTGSEEDELNEQLQIENFMGLFILYGCFVFVAVATYYAYQLFCPPTVNSTIPSFHSSKPVVELAQFPLSRKQKVLRKQQDKKNNALQVDEAIGLLIDIKAMAKLDADRKSLGPVHDFKTSGKLCC